MTVEEGNVRFAAMLKENPNIEKIEPKCFYDDSRGFRAFDRIVMPQLEHNYYSKRFPSLQRMEAASMRAALVAKALGNGLQGKPSIQYGLLKSNADLIQEHFRGGK